MSKRPFYVKPRTYAYRGLQPKTWDIPIWMPNPRMPLRGTWASFLLTTSLVLFVLAIPAIVWTISQGVLYLRAHGWL